jgi:RNA polymerase sigma-70 factor (ECF subfamily)
LIKTQPQLILDQMPKFLSAAGPLDDAEPAGDADLVTANKVRLQHLFEQNAVFIWRSLRRLGVSREVADDATQQVFLVAARRIRDIGEGKERAFLFQSAMRIAMEMRRECFTLRQRYEADEHVLFEHADPAPQQDATLDHQRALEQLSAVLEAMPVERRAVFVLYEIEGITMAEIASMLQIPPGTVASRLRLARDEFRSKTARLTRSRLAPGDQR